MDDEIKPRKMTRREMATARLRLSVLREVQRHAADCDIPDAEACVVVAMRCIEAGRHAPDSVEAEWSQMLGAAYRRGKAAGAEADAGAFERACTTEWVVRAALEYGGEIEFATNTARHAARARIFSAQKEAR